MRLVVACGSCKQQFDASGWDAGSRFRCYCGVVVAVEVLAPHDAAVIRCSACGAASSDQGRSCEHCGADFTLSERDLDGVCPGCLARISSKGKYCHHCGTPVQADPLSPDATDLPCPVCGDQQDLHPRTLSNQGHLGLECRRCTGLWLDHTTFDHFVGKAKERAVAGLGADDARQAAVARQQVGPAYRKCVRCKTPMNRQNYGKRSNVVVDVCRAHGVWFDADELSRILQWVQSGGHARSAERDRKHAELARKEQALANYLSVADPATTLRPRSSLGAFVGGLAGLWE